MSATHSSSSTSFLRPPASTLTPSRQSTRSRAPVNSPNMVATSPDSRLSLSVSQPSRLSSASNRGNRNKDTDSQPFSPSCNQRESNLELGSQQSPTPMTQTKKGKRPRRSSDTENLVPHKRGRTNKVGQIIYSI